MFNQNVAITVGSNTVNYGLTSIVGGKAVRSNAEAAITAPDIFTISHQVTGKGAAQVDRHLVRIDTTYNTVTSAGDLINGTATAYVVLVCPHGGVTKGNVEDAYSKVVSFLGATESGSSSTNLARILNGEP